MLFNDNSTCAQNHDKTPRKTGGLLKTYIPYKCAHPSILTAILSFSPEHENTIE